MDEWAWTGDTGCTHETYMKLKGSAYITSIQDQQESVRTTRITHVSEKLPNLEGADTRKTSGSKY